MADSKGSLQKLTVSPVTGLTPVQEQACILLAAGDCFTTVSEKLHVTRYTLYQWQQTDVFKCYYNQQLQEVKENLRGGLLAMHRMAMDTISDIMANGGEALRLKAAMYVCDKVEALQVEQTDIRALIADKLAFPDMVCDSQEYRRELKKRGLSEQTKLV